MVFWDENKSRRGYWDSVKKPKGVVAIVLTKLWP